MKKLLQLAVCALALSAFTTAALAEDKPAAGSEAPAPTKKKDEKKKEEPAKSGAETKK